MLMRDYLFATVAFGILCVLLCEASVQDESTSGYMSARDNTCGPSLTWSFSDGTLRISGTGEMNNYTEIRRPWYDQESKITNIVIDVGVNSIGDRAFLSCEKVKTVTIPSTITSIGNESFMFCEELASVTVPAAVTSIGKDAFTGCTKLTSIDVEQGNSMYVSVDGVLFNHNKTTLIHYPSWRSSPTYDVPGGVTLIEENAFYIAALTSVTIPSSVESIGKDAFKCCRSLTDVFISDGVKSIGEYAFGSCSQLESVTIPGSVESIMKEAFHYCTSLTRVNISDGVKSIGSSSFFNCIKLKSITIPGSVEFIGQFSFDSCISLTDVIISDGVKRIGTRAFRNCTQLKSLFIPGSVESISDSAFQWCTNLASINISDGLKYIGYRAFSDCEHLESVSIPASVDSIDQLAFNNCSNLVSVFYQGSSVITSSAFRDCDSLNTVCVSPDCNSSSFCDKDVTSANPLCQEFRSLFDHCYVAAYVDGGFIQQQRKNVSIWENQTNPCTVYYCDNATGPESSALVTCDNPPPCYRRQGHCNVNNGRCEYDRVDEWNELMEQENHCYGLVCEENETKMKERDNATAWNKHSNNCYVYQCDNESGLRIAESCSELGRICVNEECVEKTEMIDKPWIVEIELDGVPAIDMEVSEVEKNVMITSGMNENVFRIGYEVDEDGYVIRISIYVTDEKTANDIASAINKIEKGSCSYGVICKKTRVHVTEISIDAFSQAPKMFIEMILVMMIISLFLMTVDI